jgi:hypothetical protein
MVMVTVVTNDTVVHVTDQVQLALKCLTLQSRRYLRRLDWQQDFIDVYFEGPFATKKPQEILSHKLHLT